MTDNEKQKTGPKTAGLAEANEWLLQSGHTQYSAQEHLGGPKNKFKFLDKNRHIEFVMSFYDMKQDLKKNANKVFFPSKQEKKEAQRQGYIKKYGIDTYSAMDLPGVKEKAKKTIKEKYGEDSFLKTEQGQKFAKERMAELHGIENAMENSVFRDKIKATNLVRYGHESSMQNPDIKKKAVLTNIEKYGFPTPGQNEEVKKKIVETQIKNGVYSVHDNKNAKQWAAELGVSHSHMCQVIKSHGWEVAEKLSPKKTSIEIAIENILLDLNVEFIKDRKLDCCERLIRPDFVIPEKKLIIEADGLFYHSDCVIKDKKYHLLKLQDYEKMGYRALFFRQDEIISKHNIVKSIIQNRLGLNVSIGARKTKIKLCEKPDVAKVFFEKNHLMGPGAGRTFFLVTDFDEDKEDIQAAIQVRWKDKESGILEISRFCTKNGVSIVGGFSKLIHYITEQEFPKRITTFIDRRYGRGDYLAQLGFSKSTESLSFSWTNGSQAFHRMKFPGNTGYEKGFFKIWDCGQAKWTLKCDDSKQIKEI